MSDVFDKATFEKHSQAFAIAQGDLAAARSRLREAECSVQNAKIAIANAENKVRETSDLLLGWIPKTDAILPPGARLKNLAQ